MTDIKKDHRLEEILMYADGALTDAERAELEEHIRGCPECQANLEEVGRFLPMLHKALAPDEPSPEELVAWAKAKMREEEAQPAGLFTRMRVALVGFGLATATAIFLFVQSLLGSGAPPLIAHSDVDAGPRGGVMLAPRPPGFSESSDASPDAGVDGGVGKLDRKGGEKQ
jgi:anti-sigma factor RsiW